MAHSKVLMSLVLCFGFVFALGTVHSAPPIPGTYDPETMLFYESGLPVPQDITEPGELRSPESYRGVWRFPVIFIHANDVPYTFEVSEWAQQLFTLGTFPTGSFREYYREVSYGVFDIDGGTTGPMGWITADNPYAFYHQNNYGFGGGAALMAREAVEKANAMYSPDWSEYDNDNNGEVDGIVIIHQGPGGEGGNPNQIWSHVSSFEPLYYNGIKIARYSIQPETRGSGAMETIGTLCHEHGHVLGLPDLYDIAYTSKPTPVGRWCLMGEGSSGGNPYGSKPAHLSAFCKDKLGFVNTITIDANGTYQANYVQANMNNSVYKIPVHGSTTEYFIIENRYMNHGLMFDVIPTRFVGGLMVYHVDSTQGYANSGENAFWIDELEDANPATRGDLADAGFSSNEGRNSFTQWTTPNTDGNYVPSGIDITNVTARGQTISFDVALYPTLLLNTYDILSTGNNTYAMLVSLKNISVLNAGNLTGTISTTASNVSFATNTAPFGNINAGGTGSNTGSPFVFSTTSLESSLSDFTIVLTGSGNYTSKPITFKVPVNPAQIMVVDNDTRKGDPGTIEQYFHESLDLIQLSYHTWDVLNSGLPSLSLLNLYDLVIWVDGAKENTAPRAGEALDVIKAFLDQGGDLFWSSHEFLYNQYKYPNDNDYVETQPGEFARDYLKILAIEQDEYTYDATGAPGTNIAGITYEFEDVFSTDPTGADPTGYGWWPDEFVLDSSAIPLLIAGPHRFPAAAPDDWKADADEGENVLKNAYNALLYQGEYRLCFMGIPVHGISTTAQSPATRHEFLQSVFAWFGITTSAPGIDIDLNKSVFHPGDQFKLSLRLRNPGPPVDATVFVALECYGLWYFWPAWSEAVSFENRSLPTGYRTIETLLEFEWPSGAGTGAQTRFWTVAVDNNMQILGNYDFCPASWTE